MEKREDSEFTGLSQETKATKIRRATEADLVFIERELRDSNIDTEHLDFREFVVAVEDGKFIGCGRLRKVGESYQIGCVVVTEDKRRLGIGSLIVKHLMDLSSVNLIYVVTDLVDYFKKLGFSEMKEGSKELLDALDEACKVKGKPNTVLLVYERSKVL